MRYLQKTSKNANASSLIHDDFSRRCAIGLRHFRSTIRGSNGFRLKFFAFRKLTQGASMQIVRLKPSCLFLSLLTIACFLASNAVSVARAQSAVTGGLSGVVADATGAVVPGAKVVVIDAATDAKQTVTTNAEGRYTVGFLRPGQYTVTASAANLQSDSLQVTVILGTTTTGDIKVTPTGTHSVVEVSASALPLVDTQNITLATTFSEEQIQDLPTPWR